MTVPFELWPDRPHRSKPQRITQQRFLELKDAATRLVVAQATEEQFDHVVENFLEFEKDALYFCLAQAARPLQLEFTEMRRTLNRRLMNYMTVARQYTETIEAATEKVTQSKRARTAIRETRHSQYDRQLGYRTIEYLRNIAQHVGQPLHGSGVRMQNANARDPSSPVEISILIYINTSELRLLHTRDKPILDELRAMGDRVDARILLREHVEGLFQIQNKLRDLAQPAIEHLTNKLADTIARKNTSGTARMAAHAVHISDDGRQLEEVQIFAGLWEYREQLELKNGRIGRLSQNYVTNRHPDKY